jgi:16S rRNA processing protein RimM
MTVERSVEDLVTVGVISKPHGVRGEVRISLVCQLDGILQAEQSVWLRSPRGRMQACRIAARRGSPDSPIVALDGHDSRDSVEALRGWEVVVPAAELPELEDGSLYEFQVLGRMVMTEEGEVLGVISEILETGANDVWVVQNEAGGELLLPVIEDVLVATPSEGPFVVRLLEGLREANSAV